MNFNSKIYVAGHKGLVGSAILRNLQSHGFYNILTIDIEKLDLRRQKEVEVFFYENKPEYVFLAAAKVGGIHANDSFPAEFLYDNLMIEANVINSAYLSGVKKLLFLGSSCIYPKFAQQPIKEDYLLTGTLEPTNEAYAIAKITGIELCKFYRRQYGFDFISAMPTNLYGINDNFDLNTSHVLPALIRKFHEAKILNQPSVTIWGTGKPMREFLYVDDLADALTYLMLNYSDESHINVGTGQDVSISELASLVTQIVGYKGKLIYDTSKPDGTPRKLLDVTLLNNLGWNHKTELKDGITKVYQWYIETINNH